MKIARYDPKDNKALRFLIHGWGASPLRREGTNWVGFSNQTPEFLRELKKLEVGDRKPFPFPFRTAAGILIYEVERVA